MGRTSKEMFTMCSLIRKSGMTLFMLGFNIGSTFAYHIIRNQPSIAEDRSDVVLTRQLKSTNSTSDGTSSGGSPAFFDDPGNKAMYLVLPILVLIYGGCSSIYCVHKCRMYLRRRKAKKEKEKRRQERERMNDILSENNDDNKMKKPRLSFEKSKTMYHMDIDKTKITQNARPKSSMATITSVLETARITTPPVHDAITLDDLESQPADGVKETDLETQSADDLNDSEMRTTNIDSKSDEDDNIETSDLSAIQTKENIAPKGPEVELIRQEVTDVDDNQNYTKEQSIVTDLSTPQKEKKKLKLSFSEVAEILAYYGERKHKPDVIPTRKENDLPMVKKTRKWKKKVFES